MSSIHKEAGLAEPLGPTFASSPALADWPDRVGERAAVKAGMRVLEGG